MASFIYLFIPAVTRKCFVTHIVLDWYNYFVLFFATFVDFNNCVKR